MMVVDDRCDDSIGRSQKDVLCRSIDQSAIWISSEFSSQPENMIGPLASGGQKNDSETGTNASPAGLVPQPQNSILIRFVSKNLGTDAVLALRIERFGGVVDFKYQIEPSSSECELQMKIGLLTVLPHLQSQSTVAQNSVGCYSFFLTGDQGMNDDVSSRHRMTNA